MTISGLMLTTALALLWRQCSAEHNIHIPSWSIHGSQQPSQWPEATKTFSEQTASTAVPTTSGVAIDHGKAYINYTTITGFFLQDEASTNASTFVYTTVNFGLINRTYPGEDASASQLPQWARFDQYLQTLNQQAPSNVDYRLLFIERHGEGVHNVAQTYYGTPAWNCYWAEANGNGTAVWADAHLTETGIQQALVGNAYWQLLLSIQQITPPQSFYVSPLYRCLQTAYYTYSKLTLPSNHPYVPRVKELLREGIDIHTCDRRSNHTYIAQSFPAAVFDRDFTFADVLWNGITSETPSAQDYRSTVVLDDIFSTDPASIIALITHSGETASLLRVLGHQPFALGTGQILPVLVKAETFRQPPPEATTVPWTAGDWCTNGPPLASGTACTCSDGVAPTAVYPGAVFTTQGT